VGVLLYFSDDSVLPINHTDDSLPRSTAHFAPVDRRHRVDHLGRYQKPSKIGCQAPKTSNLLPDNNFHLAF